MLSVETVWSARAPCSNHSSRMSVMRETGGKIGHSKFAAAVASIGFGECRIRKNTNLKSGSFPVQKFSRTAASVTNGHEGQRCALLTTKSRNTCTRATVFNSSG